MDEETHDLVALRRALADLRRVTTLLGWRRRAVHAVARHVHRAGLRAFTLCDVGTGSADVPVAIAGWAADAGVPARIVASDVNPATVAIATELAARTPNVTVERQDATALPYPAGSFDVGLCTFTLHHFAAVDAVRMLAELGRVARHVIVLDVERSAVAWAGAVVLTHGLRMDAITRHDGPASARRAYTAGEVRRLARRASLRNVSVRRRVPFALVLDADGD